MRTIRLQVSVTLNEDAETALLGLMRRAVSEASGFDEQREARLRASRHAHFGGEEPPEDESLLIDTKATAKLLNVCDRTVWGMAKDGRMPQPVRIGRAVRWNREELRAWVNSGCPV